MRSKKGENKLKAKCRKYESEECSPEEGRKRSGGKGRMGERKGKEREWGVRYRALAVVVIEGERNESQSEHALRHRPADDVVELRGCPPVAEQEITLERYEIGDRAQG